MPWQSCRRRYGVSHRWTQDGNLATCIKRIPHLLTGCGWKLDVGAWGRTPKATDQYLACDLFRELHCGVVLNRYMSQRTTRKAEVNRHVVDSAEESEGIAGGDCWIEDRFIAARGSISRLQIEHSGMWPCLDLDFQSLIQVIHGLYLRGPCVE